MERTKRAYSTRWRAGLDFLRRSKQELENGPTILSRNHAHEECQRLWDISIPDLLRTLETQLPNDSLYSVHQFAAQCRLSSETNELKLLLLLDRYRHVHLHTSLRHAIEHEEPMPNLSPSEFCHLHSQVQNASFFSPIISTRHRMCHLFSKVLNIRCHGREFSTLALRYIENDNQEEVLKCLVKLFTASLLGCYKWSVYRITNPIVRRRIYQLFVDSNAGLLWFLVMIKEVQLMVIHSIREFVMFSIGHNPSLRKYLSDLMQLRELWTIVTNYLDEVRKYFDNHLQKETSALSLSFEQTEVGQRARERVMFDLNSLLAGSHDAVLKISYRRPNLDAHGFVLSMRKFYPMIPYTDQHQGMTLDDSDDEEEEVEALDKELDEAMLMENDVPDDSNAGVKQVRLMIERKLAPQKESKAIPLFNYVTKPVYKAIQEVVQCCDPWRTGAMKRFVEWMGYFGIDSVSISYLKILFDHYELASLSIEKLKAGMVAFRENDPYAYTLIQLAADMIREASRHYFWMALPEHLTRYQVEAIQSSFGLVGTNMLPKSRCHFTFCHVCNRIYSLIQVFPNEVTGKKQYTQDYKFGLRGASMEYTTGLVFCKNRKSNHRGQCGKHPLTELPLIGRLLFFHNNCYMICPQLGCGLPMLFNAEMCAFNERGPACSICSKKMRERVDLQAQLVSQYSVNPSTRCLKCNNLIQKNESCHWFPFDIRICKKHMKPGLLDYIKEWLDQNPEPTADSFKGSLLEFYHNYKENEKLKNEAKWRYQVKVSRAAHSKR